ncbi:hypothetical protein Trydic_g9590 [Trypoxylus dichotomus]
MLYKAPKPQNKKFIRSAIAIACVAEGLFFVGCYGVWHKLNTDRSFRKYMHNRFPSILDYYYSLSEKLGFTGLGYVLYLTCTRTESEIEKLTQSLPGVEKDKSEVRRKREELFKALQAATTDKPIYLQTKEDLKRDSKN